MLKEIDDVLINKVASVERCVFRAREEYNLSDDFKNDFSRQDAAILNISRACEQAVDIANHVARIMNLKVANSSGDSFELMLNNKIIDDRLCGKMKKMIGFRNIVIHEYDKINIEIVEKVIKNEIDDLLNFAKIVFSQRKKIEALGMVRKIAFDTSREVDSSEVQEIVKVMRVVYECYQDEKDKVSATLNSWRKHQLISAAEGYKQKFYRYCISALDLFFTDENSISSTNKYKESEKVTDKDLEEYYRNIKYFV